MANFTNSPVLPLSRSLSCCCPLPSELGERSGRLGSDEGNDKAYLPLFKHLAGRVLAARSREEGHELALVSTSVTLSEETSGSKARRHSRGAPPPQSPPPPLELAKNWTSFLEPKILSRSLSLSLSLTLSLSHSLSLSLSACLLATGSRESYPWATPPTRGRAAVVSVLALRLGFSPGAFGVKSRCFSQRQVSLKERHCNKG